jgi:hypothetical protein
METPRRDNDRAQARPSARDRRSWADAWLLERNVPTRRSLSGPVGGRLLRSTSWRLWPLTTRRLMVRRVRYCAGRVCIPAISWNGAGPVTRAR